MIKVLIVNTYLDRGGAAIAARRLAEALYQTQRVEVAFLHLYPQEIDCSFEHQPIVETKWDYYKAKCNFIMERAQIFLANGFHRKNIFHISTNLWGQDISNHPLVRWADIVHLHWICQGMLSLEGLKQLAMLNKKICWTLHDMWTITSVSPHLSNPNQYISPWEYKEKRLVYTVWKKKQSIYSLLNPLIIGCSKWIADMARLSRLTQGLEITNVANPIDTQKYCYPNTKDTKDSFCILIGAVNVEDERKGFGQMLDVLAILNQHHYFDNGKSKIVLFGKVSDKHLNILRQYPIEKVGYVDKESDMIDLYQNAHCLLVPSLYENLPNTIMESLSCGTPCVAFGVGGIVEMIKDGYNGYIAPSPFVDNNATTILAHKLMKMIDLYVIQPQDYIRLTQNARLFSEQNYSMNSVVDRIITLYQEKLNS